MCGIELGPVIAHVIGLSSDVRGGVELEVGEVIAKQRCSQTLQLALVGELRR